jgi:NAD(P)H-hydrate epimerase
MTLFIHEIDAFVFSRDAIRKIDEIAVERYGIPSIVLMENAALGCATSLIQMGNKPDTDYVIVCGPGNNGGDGFAIARHLHNFGCPTTTFHTHPRDHYADDARTNLDICLAMKLVLLDRSESDFSSNDIAQNESLCLVDALLGTGSTSAPRGVVASAINWINEAAQSCDAPVAAIDLPSGLDCDTGEAFNPDCCVRATHTLTMAGYKLGFKNPGAARYTGKHINLIDIGVPRELLDELGESTHG